MRHWVWVGLTIGALAGAGCSSPATQNGVVIGRLVQDGGPVGAAPRAVAGAVIASKSGGSTKTTVVGSNGQFRMELPVGRYTFMGAASNTPQQCVDQHAVVVTSSRVVSTQVVCPIP